MKPSKLILCFLSVLSLLLAGCRRDGNTQKNAESANTITANELAALQDFHWWKFCPQFAEAQPDKELRIVFLRADKTKKVVYSGKFTPPFVITNILLGLRADSNQFTGNLLFQGNAGVIESAKLNFTNELDEFCSQWGGGSPDMSHVSEDGNGRCEVLARFRKNSDINNSEQESVLEIELLR
jgi:hypothetical protein